MDKNNWQYIDIYVNDDLLHKILKEASFIPATYNHPYSLTDGTVGYFRAGEKLVVRVNVVRVEETEEK